MRRYICLAFLVVAATEVCAQPQSRSDAVSAIQLSFAKAVSQQDIQLMKNLLATGLVRVGDDISRLDYPSVDHFVDIAVSECRMNSLVFILGYYHHLDSPVVSGSASYQALTKGCFNVMDKVVASQHGGFLADKLPHKSGFTLLHEAFLESNAPLAKWLFENQADPNASFDGFPEHTISFTLAQQINASNFPIWQMFYTYERPGEDISDPSTLTFNLVPDAKNQFGVTLTTMFHYRCVSISDDLQARAETFLLHEGGTPAPEIPERPWHVANARPVNGPRCWSMLRAGPWPGAYQ